MDGMGELNNTRSVAVKIREEGELSSSDDDDNDKGHNYDETRVCSTAQSTGTFILPAPPGTVVAPPFDKFSQGRSTSGTNTATSIPIHLRMSMKPNSDRSFENNQAPFQSSNPAYVPSVANNNLVISFSDNDSGTESEEEKHEKGLDFKGDTARVDDNRRLPSLSSAKSSKFQLSARNVNKVIPRKSSLSRTFISSMTKVNGSGNSRGTGPSSVEQGSRVRNISSINKSLASQEHGYEQGMGLNNTKLRDLRQQIALRERELKLKSALQNKESVEVSGRDNAMNVCSDAAGKANTSSFDVRRLQPNEPDKKRLRVSGSYSCSTQLNPKGQKEVTAAKSISQSKEKALENSRLEDRNAVDCSLKGSPTKTTESSLVKRKKQDDKQAVVLSTNLPSANIISNCSKSDMSSMQVDTSAILNQTIPPTKMNSSILAKNIGSGELKNPSKSCGHQQLGPLLLTSVTGHNLRNSCGCCGAMACDEPSLKSTSQTSLDNVSIWNLSSINVAENGNTNIESLVEMEEALDKELEEAQDERRRCEIEERNALKAYRKAQRALLEANSRCTELYRKREMHSAQFRSFMMNDSNLLWSSRQHEHFANNTSRNVDQIPTSSNRIQPEQDGYNQAGYDSSIQCVASAPLNTSYQNKKGHNLGSEPCSEPDGSMTEPLPHTSKNAANGISSPSNDPVISADDDEETFPLDHKIVCHNFKSQQGEQNSVGRQKDANHHSDQYSSLDQDTLILEENLRSELCARYGGRTFSKNSGSSNVEPAEELGTDNDNGSVGTQTSNDSFPFSETQKNQEYDIGGNDNPESISEGAVQIQKHEKGLDLHSAADAEDKSIGSWLIASILSPSVLMSAFSHLKVVSSLGSNFRKNLQGNMRDDCSEVCDHINSEETKWRNVIGNLVEGSGGSFTCNIMVDPFWPFCLYELRGKCNNDECPWQHVRDFSDGNVCQLQHQDSDTTDCQVGFTLHQPNSTRKNKLSKLQGISTPTYLVGLDILKADPHSYRSVVAQRNGLCWQKCFTMCLALSSFLQKDLTDGELVSFGGDGRIEVHGSWSRQLSYFQSRSNVNNLNEAAVSNEQSLETAVHILSQEVNRLEGIKKALSVLSRAIEADPKSEILWIIHLLIFYSNIESVGKHDMFSYAVKHNDSSYELWLMYINSRVHLDDRLAAYNAALKVLCQQAAASERDEMHVSACILDLFLQMMDCLCMSGNVEIALQKINQLFPVPTYSDEPHSLLLSDMLTCLSISDKYMFWVCCVYLVIYRKLPDAITQRFECEKDLLAIEWPSVHLCDEDKQRVVRLMEMAVDSLKLDISGESLKSETHLRSSHHFALSHMRFMLALDDLECCQDLLDNYIRLYPSCIEFVLISARFRTNESVGSSFEVFEEAITNWPKEVPGINCIWNQCIELALQKGGPNLAKEVIARWFDSISKIRCPQSEILDPRDSSRSHGSLEFASASNPDFLIPSSNQLDIMFGFINISLAKLLQNDHIEARFAIDRALKSAAPGYINHCLREHAMFFLTVESHLQKDASISEQLNILNGYLDDARAFPVSEPLSRQFLNKIEKPKIFHLISNLLSPLSYDIHLVNLVLEVWYGPSLLPPKLSKPKELVDFVEAILEMVPSNYQLVFSVFKLLSGGYNSVKCVSGSILYWASSSLVNAIFHAIPIAPEHVWVAAASILGDISGVELISDRFYKRALSVYPFSVKLWNCYYNQLKTRGDASAVVEAAKKKGIEVS